MYVWFKRTRSKRWKFSIAGNYGEKGFEELERMINSDLSGNVCIAYSEKVKSLAEPAEFDKILNSLR